MTAVIRVGGRLAVDVSYVVTETLDNGRPPTTWVIFSPNVVSLVLHRRVFVIGWGGLYGRWRKLVVSRGGNWVHPYLASRG